MGIRDASALKQGSEPIARLESARTVRDDVKTGDDLEIMLIVPLG